jgi:hypothetical protein
MLNKKVSIKGISYTCLKSGKKLKWVKTPIATKKPPIKNNNQTSTAIATVEGSCNPNAGSQIAVADGTLYCVQVSDGTYKYVERYYVEPTISNPQSPASLEACEAPDLRGSIPSQMSPLAIAHNSPIPTDRFLKHLGTINILVVPIDFSDAVGTTEPDNVYKYDFDTMAKWFTDYSNDKLKLKIDIKKKWFRAPLPAATYDPALWPSNDYDTQLRLAQDYVNLTSSEIDYSNADAVVLFTQKVHLLRLVTCTCGIRICSKAIRHLV